MALTAPVLRTGNGLSLLANKCAANTFDISSGMVYASMRDQIVRAQLLITDLCHSDPGCERILIVGAGIAGVTAGACAAALGREVVVLEAESLPFALQQKVTQRKVGPFMYEWPSLLSQSQDYPPMHASLSLGLSCTPSWTASKPIAAADLINQLMPWYNGLAASYPNLRLFCSHPSATTKQYVQDFVEDSAKLGPADTRKPGAILNLPDGSMFRPDYVVLAVGMGMERVHLIDGTENQSNCVKGLPFWDNDDFKVNPRMDWHAGVFGGGDGALQDVLRLLTPFDHPLDFIDALRAPPGKIGSRLDKVVPELDTIEQQSRLLHTWSKDVYELIDSKCQRIAGHFATEPVVIERVLELLRPGVGTVFHVHRGEHFTKAYLLNRFCVHLIEICLAHRSPAGRVAYERIKNVSAKSGAVRASGQSEVTLDNGRRLVLDRVAVRFGANRADLVNRQLIKLAPNTQADRTSLAGIPLPYLVAQ